MAMKNIKRNGLKPLLDGEIRSCFGMTEPGVASSDATNMQATAVLDGDEYVINGEKWWTSGAGDPRCKIMIFMGVTNPDNAKHQRHSMILSSNGCRWFRGSKNDACIWL